jgi:general L-amino acid transport system permease protein
VASLGVYLWARRRQRATGQQFPILWTSLGLILGLPFIVYLLLWSPLDWQYPVLRGFNFQGGIVMLPEFIALLLGLATYTASFIAEIVRAGILGVPKGQKEAARAVGLSNGQMLRLVVIPQAARIIIPPLTSQYLNLTKNSSLAVAIGYPDFVSVFTGTVLNQTGQAVEVILMTMGVFLTISLLTAGFMNWFNRRMALVER